MKLCFFMGHRDAPEALFPALEAEVERHITGLGGTDFVVGHYGQFDRLAARAVRQAKKRHPQVSLTLLLPALPGVQPGPIPRGFDGVFCPPGWRAAGPPSSGPTAAWPAAANISSPMPAVPPAMRPGWWITSAPGSAGGTSPSPCCPLPAIQTGLPPDKRIVNYITKSNL